MYRHTRSNGGILAEIGYLCLHTILPRLEGLSETLLCIRHVAARMPPT